MADVLAVRNEYRAQNWAMVIQECSNSGLSNREFCRQRGISEKTYYYWLRKLRSQMAEVAVPQLVQLESVPVPIQDDMLQIQYRGAELKLPGWIWTRLQLCFSLFSRYDRFEQGPQLLHCLRLYRSPPWH